MIDQEALKTTKEGYEFLCSQCAIIAMLPLEEWREGLLKAEALGPIIDPTLYRNYLYSKKAKFIKDLVEACIRVKFLVEAMKADIESNGVPR